MSHENEYHDNMVRMLELIWGAGYMAPGGPGNVRKLLEGTEPAGKHILDIGCGLGGPAMEMHTTHGARVTGIDLEQPLIDRANADAAGRNLQDFCQFQTVEVGALPFADESFDIVTSAGAITQTQDKPALLAECLRVLKPGGYLSCYEWMGTGAEQSEELKYWIQLEELTYDFETLENYHQRFATAGFGNVESQDATAWYRKEAHREHELLRGELYPQLSTLLGKEDADYFIEDWRAMTVVLDNGEMRAGYCRGQK